MGDANNVEATREMYRLFERRDNEGIRNLFASDIEWTQMEGFPGGGRYVGADAILDGVFSGFREEWEEWRAVVETFLDAGDCVVALGFYKGTYKSTGKYTRAEFAHVIEFESERIARFIQYTDTFKVAEAMGVVGGGE